MSTKAGVMDVCTRTVEWVDELGLPNYSPCGNPIKFKVRYSQVTGKGITTEYLCGVHCNSIKNWAKRVAKITGNELTLEIESTQ